jgi:hypothetical protein
MKQYLKPVFALATFAFLAASSVQADSEEMIWISGDEDIDLKELHKMHEGEEGHKFIVIKKEIITQD